ncbi:MAG TPA: two-component regulator propeller domain-containing protein [bacterium]|nr:two-component regulator propeller domain-containing protein [bacterium]
MRALRLLVSSIFLSILFLCTNLTWALDPHKLISQYDMRIYTTRDGLPMNTVKKVFQDSRGTIWIGTQEGLVRFDGVQFTLYDKNRYTGLRSHFIRDIAEDQQGNLWLATQGGGISRFDGTSFATWDAANGLAHNVVNKILCLDDGSVLAGTENGLCRYADGQLTTWRFADFTGSENIQALLRDPAGTLLVGRFNQDLTLISLDSLLLDRARDGVVKNFCLATMPGWPSPIYDRSIGALCRLQSGEVLVGSLSGYLYRLLQNPHYSLELIWALRPERIGARICSILEDRDGTVWLATDGQGIARYFQDRPSGLSAPSDLLFDGESYETILEDREGSLWFGGDRLLRLCDKAFTAWGEPEGLPSGYGHTVCADSSGTICAGFKSGQLVLIDSSATRIIETGPNHNQILAVIPAARGGYWIGTLASGAGWFSPSGRVQFLNLPQGISGPLIRSLAEAHNQDLWAGATGSLYHFDGTCWKNYIFDPHYGAKAEVTAILEMAADDIWFGTFGSGLHRYSNGRFHQEAIPTELQHDGITLLFRDREGATWIGSNNHGLFRYRDGLYTRFTARDGLFSERIFAMLEDDSLNFWCSCNKGVFKVAKQALSEYAEGKSERINCTVYDHLDGMREAECNGRRQPSGWKSPDGRLWFTSIAGIISVDPNRLPLNPVPPPVLIETIRSSDSLYAAGPELLRLAARERDLRFRYTGLSYKIPERVRFRTRLEGYDAEWQEAGTNREAVYTNLPHGRFAFRVTACNNDNIWNNEGAAQIVLIPPFWYETWWAYFGYVLLSLAFLVWAVRRYYRRQFLTQQLKLHTEHATKLEELNEARSRFFAGISHEFRTPLTLISGPLEELIHQEKDKGKSAVYAMMLSNTRRLLALVKQLLDLAQIQSGKMALQAQPLEIAVLLKEIIASFESLAGRRHIKLSLELVPSKESTDSPLLVWGDAEKLEKIFVNLIDNAVKYTPRRGRVKVTLHGPIAVKNRQCIQVLVADNGPGIAADALPHLFDYFYRYRDENQNSAEGTGIGLALSRELVHLHRGELTVQSTPGKGSTFIVSLPTGKKHLKPEEIADESEFAGFHLSAKKTGDEDPAMAPMPFVASEESQAEDTRKTILLVEDNPDMRTLLRQQLGVEYRLHEAKDGNEGMRKALVELPDLILSDIMMPGMNGYELAQALRADIRTSHIPILLLTARSSGDDKLKGLNLGASDYLTKPFDRRELLLRIRNLLHLQEQIKERVQQDLANLGEPQAGHPVAAADKIFLHKAIAVVQENCEDSTFAAAALARQLGVSRAHLNRKLVGLCGMKTNQFIRTLRLQRAADLLRGQAGSVSEIAYSVGFNHLSYFAASFKEQYGCLPSEYREIPQIGKK